jgi:hypothetical protein
MANTETAEQRTFAWSPTFETVDVVAGRPGRR